MAYHIGTSGWSYDHWQGILYPHSTPVAARLEHYVRHFDTAELNSSFYSWPRLHTFANWRRRLPEGFLLTVKAARGLTHGKKLFAPEVWTARMARGWHELGEKRAVLLVQLPPTLGYDYDRLAYFLEQVPCWMPLAIEFRHPDWHQESIFSLLEQHQAAYCVMSGAGLPCILRATAPFVYVRMHGPDSAWLYGGSYSDDDLHWWAHRLHEWNQAGKDVFVYFNNDGGGHAVRNAMTLKSFLNI